MSEKTTKTIKKLYEFTLTDTKDGKIHKFFVKKPTVSLTRTGELFHYQSINNAIKNGLLPTVLISKRFENDDGILSKSSQASYDASYVRLAEITKELLNFEEQTKNAAPLIVGTEVLKETEKDLTRHLISDVSKKDELVKERDNLRKTLQQFEANKTSLFNISAESFARSKTIIFWVLHLSYEEDENGKQTPFYGEGTYEQRLEQSDELEEDSDNVFLQNIMKKFLFALSYWFYSGATTQKDFEQAARDFNF